MWILYALAVFIGWFLIVESVERKHCPDVNSKDPWPCPMCGETTYGTEGIMRDKWCLCKKCLLGRQYD